MRFLQVNEFRVRVAHILDILDIAHSRTTTPVNFSHFRQTC